MFDLKVLQKDGYFIIENWTSDMIYWMVENAPSFSIDNGYHHENEPLSIKISFTNEVDEIAFKLKWI